MIQAKRRLHEYAINPELIMIFSSIHSDSYEDSLKNIPCMQLARRPSLPKHTPFQRSFRNNIIHTSRGRHSFTAFKW